VRLFKDFSFLAANLMMFMLGVVLFASVVLMPQFLQALMGYTAETAGLALSAGGLVLLVQMPIVGQLTTRVQARWIVAAGWLTLMLAMSYSALRIDLLISFGTAAWLRVGQVVGLGFLFVPITLAAYIGIPAEKSNSVAGIVNFMRNIGSSVGTSLVTTLTVRRAQFHQVHLVSRVASDNPAFQDQVNALTHRLADAGLGLVYDDGERGYRWPTRASGTEGLASRQGTVNALAGPQLVSGGRSGHRLAESAASRSLSPNRISCVATVSFSLTIGITPSASSRSSVRSALR